MKKSKKKKKLHNEQNIKEKKAFMAFQWSCLTPCPRSRGPYKKPGQEYKGLPANRFLKVQKLINEHNANIHRKADL